MSAHEVTPDPKPVTEGGIGRKKARRNQKTRGHVGTIAEIRAEKLSSGCRLCGALEPLEAHHLIPRGRQGRWVKDNIIGLCQACHALVTANDRPTLHRLAETLQQDGREYDYLIGELGENAMERLFHVRYEPAIGAEATATDARGLT